MAQKNRACFQGSGWSFKIGTGLFQFLSMRIHHVSLSSCYIIIVIFYYNIDCQEEFLCCLMGIFCTCTDRARSTWVERKEGNFK